MSTIASAEPGPAQAATRPDAAKIDWVPREALSATQLEHLNWSCNGLYLQPESFLEPVKGNAGTDQTSHIDTDDRAHVTAEQAERKVNHSTTFEGEVEIWQGSRLVTAAQMSIDDTTDVASMQGPVLIREPGILLTGEAATANLFAGTGHLDAATFLLHDSRLRGRARRLHRLEDDELLIETGSFTRCDPGQNTWSLHGNSILLKPNKGHGIARDVTLRVKGIPVGYFPYFRFPINAARQSGFLTPGIGQNSDSGTELEIPYYFNLAPDYDATYTLRSLWKRGIVHDTEFRYLTRTTDSLISGAYLPKDDLYDDRTSFDRSSTAINPDFRTQDRWLIHMTHDGGWESRWKSRVRFSKVSDNDYLSDIGGDVGTSANSFSGSGETALGDRITPALNQKASLSYHADHWTTSLVFQAFQQLDEFSPIQYEKLPELTLDYNNRYSVFSLDARLRHSYFDKRASGTTNPVTGQRTVLDTTLSLPYRRAWGFVKPAVNLIHRSYQLNDQASTASANPDISTPTFSLDSGLIFERNFNLGGTDYLQTLEPRLFFLYSESDHQSDLPGFDSTASTPGYSQLFRRNRFTGYDRIGDARQVSVGLQSSVFKASNGAELMQVSLGQSYYFDDREVIFQPKPGEDPTAASSALFSRLRVALNSKFSVNSSLEWEPGAGRTNRGNLSLKYHADRTIINATYTYTAPELRQSGQFQNSEESDISFILPMGGKWSLLGRWNFNWDEDQTIESLLGVEYNDCCWKFRIAVRRFLEDPRQLTITLDDPDSPGNQIQVTELDHRTDTGIFLTFQLKGLGDLGGRLDRVLANTIPGYLKRESRSGM